MVDITRINGRGVAKSIFRAHDLGARQHRTKHRALSTEFTWPGCRIALVDLDGDNNQPVGVAGDIEGITGQDQDSFARFRELQLSTGARGQRDGIDGVSRGFDSMRPHPVEEAATSQRMGARRESEDGAGGAVFGE